MMSSAATGQDNISIFHQHWWLEAASDGSIDWQGIDSGSRGHILVPICSRRKIYGRANVPPPYTRLFQPRWQGKLTGGPSEEPDAVNIAHLLRRSESMFSGFDHVQFVFAGDSPLCAALALNGFSVHEHYTFRSAAIPVSDELWSAMHPKTRNVLRQCIRTQSVEATDDVEGYIAMARAERGVLDSHDYDALRRIWCSVRQKNQGTVLTVLSRASQALAKCILVWDDRCLYYLLSTRCMSPEYQNANSLLVWKAIEISQEKGLSFDFDGYSTYDSFRFQARFGLKVFARKTVQRSSLLWRSMKTTKRALENAVIRREWATS